MSADADDDTYDVAPTPAEPTRAQPARTQPPQPIPATASPAPLAYRSATPAAPRDSADPDTLKNFNIPLCLLAAGVLIEIIAGLLREPTAGAALTYVGIDLIVTTLFMLAGLFLAAKLRGLDLGNFWTAVLKLAAISVAPAAAFDLAAPALRHIPFGIILAWIGEFALYFAFIGMLFDLDESDTWYCVWVIFLVKLAFYFALLAIKARFM